MRDEHHRRPSGTPYTPTDPAPDPVRVLCGPLLCVLRVWSEAEWAALPGPERPVNSEHVDGLGWVGAVPTENMN